MAIQVGDRIPELRLKAATQDGIKDVSTGELFSAAQPRRQRPFAAVDQTADALRTVQLVRRGGEQVGADGDEPTGSFPTACVASKCNAMPTARATAASAAIGCTTPVSLFAKISETSAVSGPIAAASASGSTRPLRVAGTRVTRQPCSEHRERLLDRGMLDGLVTTCGARTRAPRRAARYCSTRSRRW